MVVIVFIYGVKVKLSFMSVWGQILACKALCASKGMLHVGFGVLGIGSRNSDFGGSCWSVVRSLLRLTF